MSTETATKTKDDEQRAANAKIKQLHAQKEASAKREYQKLGRLITESDFGRWYEEVRS